MYFKKGREWETCKCRQGGSLIFHSNYYSLNFSLLFTCEPSAWLSYTLIIVSKIIWIPHLWAIISCGQVIQILNMITLNIMKIIKSIKYLLNIHSSCQKHPKDNRTDTPPKCLRCIRLWEFLACKLCRWGVSGREKYPYLFVNSVRKYNSENFICVFWEKTWTQTP